MKVQEIQQGIPQGAAGMAFSPRAHPSSALLGPGPGQGTRQSHLPPNVLDLVGPVIFSSDGVEGAGTENPPCG